MEEEVVTVEMDNGWVEGLDVAHLESGRTVVVDLDPAIDPLLFWAGKRSRRSVSALPLQRNEIVSESRIARVVDRARSRSAGTESTQTSLFSDLERELREKNKDKRVEFYTHQEAWRNKLICGDSLNRDGSGSGFTP